MYHNSVNTCQNQVKLCTLKVQDDVQLAIPKCCLSIKDCQSQTSFKDFTIKALGPKILTYDQDFKTAMRNHVLPFGPKIPIDSDK